MSTSLTYAESAPTVGDITLVVGSFCQLCEMTVPPAEPSGRLVNAVVAAGHLAAHRTVKAAITACAFASRSCAKCECLQFSLVLLVYRRSIFGTRHRLPWLIDFRVADASRLDFGERAGGV